MMLLRNIGDGRITGVGNARREGMSPWYIPAMVRRFIFVILAVITLQLSWTVISAYCMHETGVAAQHFGHHQHAEDGDELPAGLKDQPGVAKKFAAHAHCSSCSHAVLAIDVVQPAIHPLAVRLAPNGVMMHFTSIFSSPPERPQWIAVA